MLEHNKDKSIKELQRELRLLSKNRREVSKKILELQEELFNKYRGKNARKNTLVTESK